LTPTPDYAALQALGAALPPFGERGPEPPGLRAYLDFYQLDFAARLPGVSHHCGRVTSGGFRLAAHRWRHPEAQRNLLLLHGYFDHVGLFGKLVQYGLSRRCNVLAFDLPGHGLSSGRPGAIDDFACYGDSIAAVLAAAHTPGLPTGVMAQSTGGAALVDFARRHHWPFRDTVLLAPLLRPVRWPMVRTAQLLLQPFVDSVPRRFSVNSSDSDFLAFLQRDPLQPRRIPISWVGALRRWLASLPLEDLKVGPALIVQGDADGTVDWRYNLPQFNRLFPGSRIELVPGAGHHLANEAQPLRERYLRAVDRYLGLAPPP
jgi:alpha-beta hydrolase superfamily lysophospholipase